MPVTTDGLITALCAAGMFLLSGGGVIWSHGAQNGRIKTGFDAINARLNDEEQHREALEARVTGLEALRSTIERMGTSIEHLGQRMVDSQKLAASELVRVAEQQAAGHKLMESQLSGFKELTDSRLSEMTDGIRSIRASFDEYRSFAPRPERRAGVRTSPKN